jgi:protein-tyrosine phosphatase
MNGSLEVRTTRGDDMSSRSRANLGPRPEAVRQRPFDIALICTGNRFRSPLAEGFLREYGRDLPLRLQSFGTMDIGPLPALPEALEAARTYGLELDRHRACSLGGARLTEVDLIIGFERIHIATAVVDAGAAKQRTFTLPEIADLLALLPTVDGPPVADRARERVAKANALRAAGREFGKFAELADPLGGPPRGYSELGAQLADLCQGVLRGLFGDSRTPDQGRLPARAPYQGKRF